MLEVQGCMNGLRTYTEETELPYRLIGCSNETSTLLSSAGGRDASPAATPYG